MNPDNGLGFDVLDEHGVSQSQHHHPAWVLRRGSQGSAQAHPGAGHADDQPAHPTLFPAGGRQSEKAADLNAERKRRRGLADTGRC
jgi:hypothetical protein